MAQIRVPSLKDRVDDVDILANHFLKIFNSTYSEAVSLSDETRVILRNYPWPGNIRELENTLKFLASVTDDRVITANSLPESFLQRVARYKDGAHADSLADAVANSEQQIIKRALDYYGRNVTGKKAAAKAIGISLATLYNKINCYKI